jgi:hypothetical protein
MTKLARETDLLGFQSFVFKWVNLCRYTAGPKKMATKKKTNNKNANQGAQSVHSFVQYNGRPVSGDRSAVSWVGLVWVAGHSLPGVSDWLRGRPYTGCRQVVSSEHTPH